MTNLINLNSLLGQVMGWAQQNSSKYIYALVPKDHTDADYNDQPLSPSKDYFRIWLSEMYLTKSRTWFVDWYPAVYSSVQLKITGQPAPATFSHVAQVPGNALSKGVFANYAVTDLLPYSGGLVNIDSALLALKGNNVLEPAIKMLQGFAGLVAPPIGQALAVADKITSGLQELLNGTQGQVHLGWHQTFASQGGGGSNLLRPGYLAVLLATGSQVDPNRLYVSQDRLCYGSNGAALQPLDGFDYLLYRIEGRTERDDWRIPEINEAITQAAQAYLKGADDEAQAYRTVALTAALQSPFLTVQDRRRVIQAIKDEIALYETGAQGAVGGQVRSLDEIMQTQPPGVGGFSALPVTFEEVFGG